MPMFAVADEQSTGKTRAALMPRFRPDSSSSCVKRAGVEKLLHQRVVGLGDHLDERFARGLRRRLELGRNRAFRGLPLPSAAKVHAFIATRSTTPRNALLLADRQLHRHDRAAEHGTQRFERSIEAGTFAVEPVQHDDARQLELGRRRPTPSRSRPRRRRPRRRRRARRPHAQRCPRIAQEIRHARRIDEVDLVLVPLERRRGCRPACASARSPLRRSRSPSSRRPRVRSGSPRRHRTAAPKRAVSCRRRYGRRGRHCGYWEPHRLSYGQPLVRRSDSFQLPVSSRFSYGATSGRHAHQGRIAYAEPPRADPRAGRARQKAGT